MKIVLLAALLVLGCARLATCDLTTAGDSIQTEEQLLAADAERIKKVTQQDESLGAAAFKRRHEIVNTGSLRILDDKNFLSTVTDRTVTVVLFYYPYDAKSQLTLRIFAKGADALKKEGFSGVMAAIDCNDWTQLCQRANVFTFPTIRFSRGDGKDPEVFTGVLTPSAIQTAVKLYAKSGRLDDMSEAGITSLVELNVVEFPRLMALHKPFVIAFSSSKGSSLVSTIESSLNAMASKLASSRPAVFAWMDTSKSDGIAKSILEHHVNNPKSDELLVIDQSKGTVHRYSGSVSGDSIQKWIHSVLHGEVTATTELSKSDWKPRQAPYDFLRLMDLQERNKPQETEAEKFLNKLNDEGLPSDQDPDRRFIFLTANQGGPQLGGIPAKTEL